MAPGSARGTGLSTYLSIRSRSSLPDSNSRRTSSLELSVRLFYEADGGKDFYQVQRHRHTEIA